MLKVLDGAKAIGCQGRRREKFEKISAVAGISRSEARARTAEFERKGLALNIVGGKRRSIPIMCDAVEMLTRAATGR